MNGVGSSDGRVHDQRQGVGLGTILQGDGAVDTYSRIATEQRAVGRQKAAQKQADLDAAYERMIKFNPDRWFKNEKEVKDRLNAWHNEGTAILASGRDPYKSTDPASLEWRKKQIEVTGLAMASMQTQDAYKALQTKMQGADPGKYTPQSMKELADYFDKPITEIIDKRLSPPTLMQTKPNLQLQDYFSKVMQPINTTRNGVPYTDGDRWKIVNESLQDPEKGADLAESFSSMFQQMEPARREDLRKRAKAGGVSEMQQGAYDYVTRYESQRKPFDYGDWTKTALGRVDVPYKEWRGTESFSKKTDKAELNKITNAVADDMFYDDDRALTEYEQVLPRTPGETDKSYRTRSVADFAQSLREQTATQELAGQTDKGKDGKDLDESSQRWLKDMMNPNSDNYSEAAGFVVGTKIGNMRVSQSERKIQYRTDPLHAGESGPVLSLQLDGNLSLKEVKEQLPGEIAEEVTNVEQRGTETEINIPINTKTENWLLTVHNDRMKQTGIGYKGPYTETKIPTLGQMGGGTSSSATPKFNFKK